MTRLGQKCPFRFISFHHLFSFILFHSLSYAFVSPSRALDKFSSIIPNPRRLLISHLFFHSQTLKTSYSFFVKLYHILSLSRKQKMILLKSDKPKRLKMVVRKQKSQLRMGEEVKLLRKKSQLSMKEESESPKPVSAVFTFHKFLKLFMIL